MYLSLVHWSCRSPLYCHLVSPLPSVYFATPTNTLQLLVVQFLGPWLLQQRLSPIARPNNRLLSVWLCSFGPVSRLSSRPRVAAPSCYCHLFHMWTSTPWWPTTMCRLSCSSSCDLPTDCRSTLPPGPDPSDVDCPTNSPPWGAT